MFVLVNIVIVGIGKTLYGVDFKVLCHIGEGITCNKPVYPSLVIPLDPHDYTGTETVAGRDVSGSGICNNENTAAI